jgi:5'-nucleotidase
MSTTTLRIAHFNDVYRVQPFKIDPKSSETIDVTQFAQGLADVRASWPDREDSKGKDGLVLFSGDVFSPSVQSSVTRGSHMVRVIGSGGSTEAELYTQVPVMNDLAPDVSLTGNHDFDFGEKNTKTMISLVFKQSQDILI